MMKDILFLDCTLRDGAHVVSGEFKRSRIINVVRKLTESKTDIIEIGFLKEGNESLDKIYYPKIERAYSILDEAGITDSNHCSIYA